MFKDFHQRYSITASLQSAQLLEQTQLAHPEHPVLKHFVAKAVGNILFISVTSALQARVVDRHTLSRHEIVLKGRPQKRKNKISSAKTEKLRRGRIKSLSNKFLSVLHTTGNHLDEQQWISELKMQWGTSPAADSSIHHI